MLFSKKEQSSLESAVGTKNIWQQFDFTFSDTVVFLDDIRWVDGAVCFILSQTDDPKKIIVRFEYHPRSYRVTQESDYFNPFDTYDNADLLSFKDHKIFYTQDSAYLDRFYAVSEMSDKATDLLYHIQIITEDLIVDVISDQLPTVSIEA